jgi:hypothetical protein
MSRWESKVGWVTHVLGLSYYLYHWAITIGLLSALAGLFYHHINRLRYLPFLVTLNGGIIISFLGFGLLFLKLRKLSEVLNPLLDVTNIDAKYQVGDAKCETYIRMTVRAKRAGVDICRTKFRWTGSGNIAVNIEPVHDVALEREVADLWEYARVRFLHPLKKGESIDFVLRFSLEGPGESARPIFSKIVDDFCPGTLKMEVSLGSAPSCFRRLIFSSPSAEIPVFEEKIQNSGKREMDFVVKRPRLGWVYKIAWK